MKSFAYVGRGTQRTLLGLAFWSLQGCGNAAPPAEDPLAPRSQASLSSPDACPGEEWVGESTSGACPKPPSLPASFKGEWRVSPLFEGEDKVPGLAGYCSYQWVSWGGVGPRDPAGPKGETAEGYLPWDANRSPQDWLSPDCQVVAPLGESFPDLPDDVSREMSDRFVISMKAHQPPDELPPQEQVRVVLLDSSPTTPYGLLSQENLGHGLALGKLIERVACPSGYSAGAFSGCAAQVRSELAMPMVSPGQQDPLRGGYFGTQTQLAKAIARAVRGHAEEVQNTKTPLHLILNLSLGWEPRGTEDRPHDTMPGPVRAVHSALRHAVCHGALVIAAAGNRSDRTTGVAGPMYPAAWERDAGLTIQDCDTFEGEIGYRTGVWLNLGTPESSSLVYAASALDAGDLPIASARPGGRSRLSALGERLVMQVEPGTTLQVDGEPKLVTKRERTDILTGSSVSAAAISSLAARTWAKQPWLAAGGVIQRLHSEGLPLRALFATVSADFALATGAGAISTAVPVQRIDGCVMPDVVCNPRPPYSPAPTEVSDLGIRIEKMFAGVAPLSLELVPAPSVLLGEPFFVTKTQMETPGLLPEIPDREAPGTTSMPWVGPQPGIPGCGRCMFSFRKNILGEEVSSWSLYVYLETSGTYASPTVALNLRGGTRALLSLSSASSTMVGGTPYVISGSQLSISAAQIGSADLLLSSLSGSTLGTRSYSTSIAVSAF